MRMFLAGLSAVLLAACSGNVTLNNTSGNAAAPSNAAAPAAPAMPGNMVMPGGEDDAGGNSAAAGGARSGNREDMLAECTQEATGALPAGTDVPGLCGCAVDRVIAGASRADAMRQCAADRNVQLPMGR